MRLSSSSSPIKIRFDLMTQKEEVQIIDAQCGINHTAFLSVKGEVYTCGNGEKGQLGIGFITMKEYHPQKMLIDIKQNDCVRQICCGDYNTSILTERGLVLISGDNTKGQLGQDNLNHEMVTKPQLIDYLSNKQIKKLTMGGKSCGALSMQGDIYVWGSYLNEIIAKPKKLASSIQPPFKEIKASNSLFAAIDPENNLWLWSSSQNNNPLELSQFPDKILELYDIKANQIYLGNNVVFTLSEDVNSTVEYEAEPNYYEIQEINRYKTAKNPSSEQEQLQLFSQEISQQKVKKIKKKLRKSLGKKNNKNQVELEPESYSISKKITDFQRQNSLRGHSQQPTKKHSKKLKQIPLNLSQINTKSPLQTRKSPISIEKHVKNFNNHYQYQTNNCYTNNNQQQPLEAKLKLKLKTIMANQSTQSSQLHHRSFHYNFGNNQQQQQLQNNITDQSFCGDNSRVSILEQYSMIKPIKDRDVSDDNTCIQNTSCSHEQDLITQINIESENDEEDDQSKNYQLQDSQQHQTLRPTCIDSQFQHTSTQINQGVSACVSNKSSCVNIMLEKSSNLINQQNESYSARFSVQTKEDPEIRLRQKYEIQCLQNENLRISSDLALERKKNDSSNQQNYMLIKERQDNYIHKDEYQRLKTQNEELQKSNQDQHHQLVQSQDKNQKLNDQVNLLKSQLGKFNDQITEKESELEQFIKLADRLQECEIYIEKLQREKDNREDELLNKMSTLADHYHKEKDKNQKLMSELTRQNEVLQRFEQHVKQAQLEKDYALSDNEKMKDELARLRVDLTINKDKYHSFVSNIKSNSESGDLSQRENSNKRQNILNKSPFKLLNVQSDYKRIEDSTNNLQNSLLREGSYSQNQQSNESLINNLHYSMKQRRNSLTKSSNGIGVYNSRFNDHSTDQRQDEKLQVENVRIRDTPIQNEKVMQDYNSHVLKSLERQAQKSSQERKLNSSFHRQARPNTSNVTNTNTQVDYQSFIRDHSPLESHREIISVLQDTQSTMFIQDGRRDHSRDAFREINNMNNTVTISQIKPSMNGENHFQSEQKSAQHNYHSQISENLNKYCNMKENDTSSTRQPHFSSNKKAYLKNLVDQEFSEIKQIINQPPQIQSIGNGLGLKQPGVRYFNNRKNDIAKERIQEDANEHQITRSNSDLMNTTTHSTSTTPNDPVLVDKQNQENSFIRENLLKRSSRAAQ